MTSTHASLDCKRRELLREPLGEKGAVLRAAGDGSPPSAREVARGHLQVHRVNDDSSELYFSVPDPAEWDFAKDGEYVHYTEASQPGSECGQTVD